MCRLRGCKTLLDGVDDFDADEWAEVDRGLRGGKGDGDFGLAGADRFTVPNREDGGQQLSVVADQERRGDAVGNGHRLAVGDEGAEV